MAYNVPDVDGVPALDFAVGPVDLTVLLSADLVGSFDGVFEPTWGIYQDGVPVVTADIVTAIEFKGESQISAYPVEGGQFANYNKVGLPFDVRVRFGSGGSAANRQALIDSIDAIADTLDLYDVVTPEAIYSNCNVAHRDYRRSASNGAGLVEYDVWFLEIRQLGDISGGSAQQASGATPVNDGTVQATPPSNQQVQTLNASDVASAGGVP